jgi:hypothetical protein
MSIEGIVLVGSFQLSCITPCSSNDWCNASWLMTSWNLLCHLWEVPLLDFSYYPLSRFILHAYSKQLCLAFIIEYILYMGSDIASCILQNSFCFEKRDWMTVRPKELPHGSKLVWIFSLQLKLLRIPILIICNVAQNYDSNRPWLLSPNMTTLLHYSGALANNNRKMWHLFLISDGDNKLFALDNVV